MKMEEGVKELYARRRRALQQGTRETKAGIFPADSLIT